MSNETPNLLQRFLRVLAEVVVGIYVVADATASFLFRPVMRWLSGLRIIQRLERGIDALPAYVILVLMLVPFVIAELAKVFALFWMSEGHFRSGMTIFIGAYIVSIFVCERILHAGKRKLMTIRWFAWCYTWVMTIRDYVLGWFKSTAVWKMGVELKVRTIALWHRAVDRFHLPSRSKPRDALERR